MTPRDYGQISVWAPKPSRVDVILDGERIPLTSDGDWWTLDRQARPGQRYWFSLDGADPRPDPRSLLQPEGVHGPSEVFDPTATPRAPWPGMDLRGRVLYELHVGAFTEQGTFDAAIGHLDELADLGVEAVEVMPVAQTPGSRNWGYDGVDLFATNAHYGGPAGFLRFVDAAHRRGLGVILDVVYNHLGPEGNYLASFGPYFNPAHQTPWGEAVNLDGEHARPVRDFLLANARQWLVDFGLDGLRLDAVHALVDDSEEHFLAELSRHTRAWSEEAGRPLTLIAESDVNQPATVSPIGSMPGATGMGMQWADDVHHGLHAFFTGERQGYYVDFGSAETLAKALTRAFVHDGGWSTFRKKPWGAPTDPHSDLYDGHSFVVFVQDHDQVGNRAIGDRISQGHDAGLQAGAAALYLLGPFTPMIFMGEEWAASTPFPYFCDMGPELGPLVTAGRRQEFAGTGWAGEVPDPEDPATFASARLCWDERGDAGHARMLAWYRRLLELRRDVPELRSADLSLIRVTSPDDDTVVMTRGEFAVIATRAAGATTVDLAGLTGPGAPDVLAGWRPATITGTTVTIDGPGAAVLQAHAAR
ncbi:malto-oligosyltrehalose trehalohydrolase [Acidipropionibacterium acidipropionici]|uniref:malto-oligosyltrehalose trehalohydrolase n=1 Tax=Acidipropionibacterium acidipropionici TaxID=1748 RepID=UPI0004060BB7|nr:malto-oligosyltrehalose trehalohydrolase [Acidipropionibacterium acidipropionici]ALN14205.1 malto-oligosyltrehalose trehalohydrolase [Acidipropionibacterium acidipropionici]APZ10035.1 malto-oligosyltrehalose trehalohydrolase [Acidipropionibacterium acidipropionici]